ncbi:spermidine coumaroyl-CoA acyltransferase-like [Lotus japonicus]|uniref:spermidine coumaroyl-CoA acyltransferase-like n=1 Tax=Lotus japonicus TaxID=34305 RepID=UPI002587EE41|nr:spermidine coumaroyl-CoA acyltransferase-like [Lotus japonicus]
MAYQKPVMKVEMKDVVLIKPSKSRPSSILFMSTLDNRPDLNCLCQTVHVYRSPPTHDDSKLSNQLLDPALVVKEALSKALLYYYPLAGRLVEHADGKLRMICSDAAEQGHGVPFIEAFANCELSSVHYLDGADNDIAKQLVFDLPTEDERGHQYPLVFKMTTFLCGGFTIGMGILHTVVDGSGASQFFRAIAELASGRSEPSVKPVWERERLVTSIISKQPLPCVVVIDKASATVSPFVPTTAITQVCFKVNSDLIRRLKSGLMKECDEDDHENLKECASSTRHVCVCSYVCLLTSSQVGR